MSLQPTESPSSSSRDRSRTAARRVVGRRLGEPGRPGNRRVGVDDAEADLGRRTARATRFSHAPACSGRSRAGASGRAGGGSAKQPNRRFGRVGVLRAVEHAGRRSSPGRSAGRRRGRLAGIRRPRRSHAAVRLRVDLERAAAPVCDLVREPQEQPCRPRSESNEQVALADPASPGRAAAEAGSLAPAPVSEPRRAAIRQRGSVEREPASQFADSRRATEEGADGRRRGSQGQASRASGCVPSTSSTRRTRPGRVATGRRRSARPRPSSGPASRPRRTGSRAVRTVDIASAGYPLKFAFGGAAKGPNPYVNIINRLQVVQFEDFDGELRTLAYEPTVPEGPAEAPYYAQQIEQLGEFLSYKVLATIWNHPDEALVKAGLRPEDVDYVSFDHLHVQDLRFVLGTTEPIAGRGGAAPAAVPEREADRPAQGVGHLRLAAPDAVGLVRRGRDQGPDHRQRRPGRGRRRAGQGGGARLDAGPHRRQPLALHQHRRTASGSRPRTASPPTTGTRTCRRSPASARPPSSSAAR